MVYLMEGVRAMSVYCIALDPQTELFYRRLSETVSLPMEQVLRDALFKLAGELALEALSKAERTRAEPIEFSGEL